MDETTEEKLPLTAHLEELKKRLIRSLIGIGIGFGACYYYKEWLFKIITKPLMDVMPKNSHMIFTSLPHQTDKTDIFGMTSQIPLTYIKASDHAA